MRGGGGGGGAGGGGADFCARCPHNGGTRAPAGARALGGIGCHTLAVFMEGLAAAARISVQMGGEGAGWISMAPFLAAAPAAGSANAAAGIAAAGTPHAGAAAAAAGPGPESPHALVYVGDGSCFHSASLAVRACVAAGVSVMRTVLRGRIAFYVCICICCFHFM